MAKVLGSDLSGANAIGFRLYRSLRPNAARHRIAALLRFGVNVKSLVRAGPETAAVRQMKDIIGVIFTGLLASYFSLFVFLPKLRPVWRGTDRKLSTISCIGLATLLWIPCLDQFFVS